MSSKKIMHWTVEMMQLKKLSNETVVSAVSHSLWPLGNGGSVFLRRSFYFLKCLGLNWVLNCKRKLIFQSDCIDHKFVEIRQKYHRCNYTHNILHMNEQKETFTVVSIWNKSNKIKIKFWLMNSDSKSVKQYFCRDIKIRYQ